MPGEMQRLVHNLRQSIHITPSPLRLNANYSPLQLHLRRLVTCDEFRLDSIHSVDLLTLSTISNAIGKTALRMVLPVFPGSSTLRELP